MSPALYLFLLTSWVQIPIVVGLPAESVVDVRLLARDGNFVELPADSLLAPTTIHDPSPLVPLMTNIPDTVGVSR